MEQKPEIIETIPISLSSDLMRGYARPDPIGYRVSAGDLIAHAGIWGTERGLKALLVFSSFE